jgi:FkbM family methyltransferase
VSHAIQTIPFGTFSLPRSREWLRSLAGWLPASRLGRAGASLIRRAIMRGGSPAYDVEVFPSVKARIYPTTNTCEKRVLTAAQFFDAPERAFLDQAVASSSSSQPFVFLDLGANVGLYGLSVLSSARKYGRTLRVISVEPDPTTRARLTQNISFSDADDVFTVEPCGVGAIRTTASIVEHANNRGENRLATGSSDAEGAIEVLPLLDICQRNGVRSIDAIKIDVEGMDYDVLQAFFASAPVSLYPRSIIVEVNKRDDDPIIVDLCEEYRYRAIKRTTLNVILSLSESVDGNT